MEGITPSAEVDVEGLSSCHQFLPSPGVDVSTTDPLSRLERARAAIAAELYSTVAWRRLPPSDVTVEQLRNRSWWSGPEIYIVVDDFDMIEGNNNPLKPLVPFLAQAADIGLHVIIARRAAGIGRSSYEPVLQGLKDAGANGILLSGDRQEGQVWPGVYLQRLPAGRANWVDKSGKKHLVQLAFYPE